MGLGPLVVGAVTFVVVALGPRASRRQTLGTRETIYSLAGKMKVPVKKILQVTWPYPLTVHPVPFYCQHTPFTIRPRRQDEGARAEDPADDTSSCVRFVRRENIPALPASDSSV
eukprot:417752-Prorocentrum_minimum.AAC.1